MTVFSNEVVGQEIPNESKIRVKNGTKVESKFNKILPDIKKINLKDFTCFLLAQIHFKLSIEKGHNFFRVQLLTQNQYSTRRASLSGIQADNTNRARSKTENSASNVTCCGSTAESDKNVINQEAEWICAKIKHLKLRIIIAVSRKDIAKHSVILVQVISGKIYFHEVMASKSVPKTTAVSVWISWILYNSKSTLNLGWTKVWP